jgi:phage terminase large subunit
MQSSLKDSVHRLLCDQIDLNEIPGYRVTDREIRHRNGTLFLFEGLRHNITKIKSLEGIDRCWVEEAERVQADSYRVLIPTIRKPGSEIWISFNPDQIEDATWQRFIVHTPKGIWRIKVNMDDNPWPSSELLEERRFDYMVDPDSADHVWGGNIREISDAQILRGKWVVEEFVIPHDADGNPVWQGPYQGEDFGFSTDPHAGIRCWVKPDSINGDTLYISHESYALQLELDDIPERVISDIPGWEKYVTRADSSRPDSISFLRRHGLPYTKGAKKGDGSIEDGIAHLRHYAKIIIHPRCVHTKDEAKRWSYKVDARSGDILPIVVDKHNHLMDSLRYALEPLTRKRRLQGFIFAHDVDDGRRLCPSCQSYLPDDGVCPSCGWTIAELDALSRALGPTEETPSPVAEEPVFPRPSREERSNGKRTIQDRVRALRGIND